MVPSHAVRSFLLDDPILDWLELHGRSRGFEPDAVDERANLGAFLAVKGLAFETVVLDWLGQQVATQSIRRPTAPQAFRAVEAAATLQALAAGARPSCAEPCSPPERRRTCSSMRSPRSCFATTSWRPHSRGRSRRRRWRRRRPASVYLRTT